MINKNLEERIQKIKEDAQKEILKAEKEISILESLPVEPHRIFVHDRPTLGESWVTYQVADLKEAFELLEHFEVLPHYVFKDSCTSIQPQELLGEKFSDTLKPHHAPLVELEVNFEIKHSTTCLFVFWTKMEDDTILKIKVEIEKHPFKFSLDKQYNGRGVCVGYSCSLPWNQCLGSNMIKWWTSSGKSGRRSYLFSDFEAFNKIKEEHC